MSSGNFKETRNVSVAEAEELMKANQNNETFKVIDVRTGL